MKTSLVTTISLVGVLATGGAAFAANSTAHDSVVTEVTSSTTIPPPSTTVVAPTSTQSVYDIPGVGIITLIQDATSLEILSVNLASGWTYDAENDHATQVKVEFQNGDQNVKFRAELLNGLVISAVDADDADDNDADENEVDEIDDDDADENEVDDNDSNESDSDESHDDADEVDND